jgi:hypothetical protein
VNTPTPTFKRIAPGLYEARRVIDGQYAIFVIEQIGKGDTAYASDVGLWAVRIDGDPGEPWYPTLRAAKAHVLEGQWHRHPNLGVCAGPRP